MKRRMMAFVLALALTLLCVAASAATRLTNYELVANGTAVALSQDTGYLMAQGSYVLIPVEQVCKAMGLVYEVNGDKTGMTITGENGKTVEILLNTKNVRVNGARKKLRTKTVHQTGSLLTADVRLLTLLGLKFQRHKPGKAMDALGYDGGALVVAKSGGSTKPPDVRPVIDLPSDVAAAAATATQIVAVKQVKGSKARAKLTFYQKVDGKWCQEFSSDAYLGKEGIGKTKEGDNKTPTGTFKLTTPFGILADPGTKLGKYVKVTKQHYWVSTDGPYYNRLIDRLKTPGFLPSPRDERLIDMKGVYNYCMFIDYNADGEAGKGSAIFLHCKGSKDSTAGCIAVEQRVMLALMRTLTPGAKIVIYA